MQFGAILFDHALNKQSEHPDKTRLGYGWLSIAGGEAIRIEGAHMIPSDCRFWTNLSPSAIRHHGINHCGILSSEFLTSTIDDVANEIGAGTMQFPPNIAVTHLSGMFDRIMRYAITRYGVDPTIQANRLGQIMLSQHERAYTIDSGLHRACKQSYQEIHQPPRSRRPGWSQLLLRRNRYAHATDVLSIPVPSIHNWHFVEGNKIGGTREQQIAWCIGSSQPVIARVHIFPKSGRMSETLSYGFGTQTSRQWLTQPELLMVSRCATINIESVFISKAGFVLQPELELFPDFGDFSLASPSAGLLAECFWSVMATPFVSAHTTGAITLPRHSWYRAMDRLLCFAAAVQLNSTGFEVASYGNGAITVFHPENDLAELLAVAGKLGLQAPASAHAEAKNYKNIRNVEARMAS
jgi:hypothetical protein